MKRKLIGWRVRWTMADKGYDVWDPKLRTYPSARRKARKLKGNSLHENVRVMRVYRRV